MVLPSSVSFGRVVLAAHESGVFQLASAAFAVGIDVINREVVPREFAVALCTDEISRGFGILPRDFYIQTNNCAR